MFSNWKDFDKLDYFIFFVCVLCKCGVCVCVCIYKDCQL